MRFCWKFVSYVIEKKHPMQKIYTAPIVAKNLQIALMYIAQDVVPQKLTFRPIVLNADENTIRLRSFFVSDAEIRNKNK